ncbi:MAG: hypothetical protein ACP5H2_06600 [Solirubrobacteraceae bacterium]
MDAFQQDCEIAIVISNDADLKEPIRVATHVLGVPVGLVNPHPKAQRSADLKATFYKTLRRGVLMASQFPPTLHDGHGTISRPSSW